MNLMSIIKCHHIDTILSGIDRKEAFRKHVEHLLTLTPLPCKYAILVEKEARYSDTVGVAGVAGTDERYSLEYRSWAEWLGAEIDAGSYNDFTQPEIVAYCLMEMTHGGCFFDEAAIQNELDAMKRLLDERC